MQDKNHSKSVRCGLLGISVIVILVDQLTKYLARSNLTFLQAKEFLPHWNWTLAYNEGAAFSFLATQGGWQKLMFGVIALVVSLGLIYYLLRKQYSLLSGISFSFILGGAIGNLIDRLIAGKVTDFIDWYAGNYHWPAFNLADSFITLGVALLIIESIFFASPKTHG